MKDEACRSASMGMVRGAMLIPELQSDGHWTDNLLIGVLPAAVMNSMLMFSRNFSCHLILIRIVGLSIRISALLRPLASSHPYKGHSHTYHRCLCTATVPCQGLA